VKKKNNIGLLIFLGIVNIILLSLFVLTATGKIKFDSYSEEDNCAPTIITDDFEIDEDELGKLGKDDYNFVKDVNIGDYSFKLEVNGKININFENYISNISDAKDIILYNSPSLESILYILTDNGDIYQYNTSYYESGNYDATKIDEYSNIKYMITYQTRKANAGGCNYIILIDNNDKYYKLNSFCI